MTNARTTHKYLFMMAMLCFIILPFTPAHAIGLKQSAIITGDTITLGDIFYDLPRDETRILGAAPNPGKDMKINARTLLRIAMALDLPWRPNSANETITLSRAATIIEYDQIKESINTALYNENIHGDYEITVPPQHHRIILPEDQSATLDITKFSLDAKRKNFKATIAAPSADNPVQIFEISGKIEPVITVPVLLNNIQHGRTIQANDIDHVKIKEREFSRDTIIDEQKLIGMTARRMLIAGRPIKNPEIIAPQLIERGEIVTMSLNESFLNLTTQVKALESGAKGDVIRVVNTASNKVLQARILASSEVAVLQN